MFRIAFYGKWLTVRGGFGAAAGKLVERIHTNSLRIQMLQSKLQEFGVHLNSEENTTFSSSGASLSARPP